MVTSDILSTFQLRSSRPYAYSTGKINSGFDGEIIRSYNPHDNELLGQVIAASQSDVESVVKTAHSAFLQWRMVPAPKRGEIVRQIGEALRSYKEKLAMLVSLECGKIYQEGLGEVQEMIDICDFAVGLSRQLCGKTMPSERPGHRLMEQWHPLGVVGVISAFNFPVAVWSWNAMIAAVCGDTIIWKPSEKTPLCAVAVQHIVAQVIENNGLSEGIFCLLQGRKNVGEAMSSHSLIPLISATGSVRMGQEVAQVVASRLGKTILELGGNNAIIVSPNANIDHVLDALTFGAVGTCGQRCTTIRRAIIHEDIMDTFCHNLIERYRKICIGNPMDSNTHVGPLIDRDAVEQMQKALRELEEQGGKIVYGGGILDTGLYKNGYYVCPAICKAKNHFLIVQKETFAPILYLISYQTIEDAISLQNEVPQGLSSSLFSNHIAEIEQFLGASGSDCGIANINISTSGAEIGGAFGGEKCTGGGREAGSDSWKAYMRRQTNTINNGYERGLAQGIQFNV